MQTPLVKTLVGVRALGQVEQTPIRIGKGVQTPVTGKTKTRCTDTRHLALVSRLITIQEKAKCNTSLIIGHWTTITAIL